MNYQGKSVRMSLQIKNYPSIKKKIILNILLFNSNRQNCVIEGQLLILIKVN